RTYEWEGQEIEIVNTSGYAVSRVLTRMRENQRIRWRLPNEVHSRSVAQISIVPPHSPITIEASGEVTFLTCSFTREHFERLLKIDGWSNELTATFLAMQNPFVEAVMDRLAQEVVLRQRDSEPLVEALLTCLTVELSRTARQGDPARRRPGKLA